MGQAKRATTPVRYVNGHVVLPVGGQEFAPLAAIEMSPVAAR